MAFCQIQSLTRFRPSNRLRIHKLTASKGTSSYSSLKIKIPANGLPPVVRSVSPLRDIAESYRSYFSKLAFATNKDLPSPRLLWTAGFEVLRTHIFQSCSFVPARLEFRTTRVGASALRLRSVDCFCPASANLLNLTDRKVRTYGPGSIRAGAYLARIAALPHSSLCSVTAVAMRGSLFRSLPSSIHA